MTRFLRGLLLGALLLPALGVSAVAQAPLEVAFRFIPDLTQPPIAPVARAFLPGSFNNWGPNQNGTINAGAASQMTFVDALAEYRYTVSLPLGSQQFYKIAYHEQAGSPNTTWITDPLSTTPCVYGQFGSDCRIEVTDPLAMQPAREENQQGDVYAVSASFFGTVAFTSVEFVINDGDPQEGLAHFDADTGLFRYVLSEPLPSPIYLSVTATDALGRSVTAEAGVLPPTVIDLARPEGLRNGITYVDDSTVRFSLFAPQKSFVHLIGSFNEWEISNDYVLFRDKEDADNVWWWIEVDGLSPGQEYAFQYVVDGTLRIADPYSEKILDPVHDPHIPSSTYPGLMPYPAGDTDGIVGVIHPGRPAYEWQTTGYERPAYQDLVVYELLIRDFIGARNFQTMRDTLDYLQRLGVNAVSLMPVSEFDGNLSWGYNPTFHAALDKFYGPRQAFKQLIDEAHGRGMAVIIDVVYNHAHDHSPIVRLYGPTAANPLLQVPPSHPYNVFLQLNHDHPFVHDYMDQANERWLSDFRVDGFRFDLTKGFMTGGSVDGHNAQRIANLKRMADAVWTADEDAYIILEHFAANSEELELANYRRAEGRPGMLMWHNMNRAYSQSAMGYLSDGNFSSNLSTTYPPHRGMPVDGLLTYMESHDEQWLMYRNRAFGPQTTDYNVRDLATALDRQKLVGTFFFTVPGPRMMWQFGELGYGWGINGEECLKPGDGSNGECPAFAPGRTAQKPLPWIAPREYHLHPERQNLFKVWEALINLRTSHPVFTSPDTDVDLRVGQGVPDRRIKLSLDDVQVVIIGNFGLTPRAIDPAFHHTGTWYEFFTDEEIEVTDVHATVWLEPGHARIFSTVDFPSPEAGIYVISAEDGAVAPAVFSLQPPYPNPATTAARIGFTLPAAADARLDVFDVLGRRVAVLVDDHLTAGPHEVLFAGRTLPSGTYVVRLQAGEQVATTRLTLVR